MIGGYINIWRSLYEHPLWTRGRFNNGAAFVDLLMGAAFKTHRNAKGQVVARGTIRTTQSFLAARFGWDRKRVQRFLSNLCDEGMITVQTETNRESGGTIITVLNFDKFQSNSASNAASNLIGETEQNAASNAATSAHQNTKNAPSNAAADFIGETGANVPSNAASNDQKRPTRSIRRRINKKTTTTTPNGGMVWAEWVNLNRLKGKSDPTPAGPNISAAKQLAALLPEASDRAGILQRFIDDPDAWLTAQGHGLRFLPGRIDAYRNNARAAAWSADDAAESLCDRLKVGGA